MLFSSREGVTVYTLHPITNMLFSDQEIPLDLMDFKDFLEACHIVTLCLSHIKIPGPQKESRLTRILLFVKVV